MLGWYNAVRQARIPGGAIVRAARTFSSASVHTPRRVPWQVWALTAGGASLAAAYAWHAQPVHLDAPLDRIVKEEKSSMEMSVYMKTDGTNVNPQGSALRLVGLGIRSVTFLRFHVYVAGLYVAEEALEATRAQHALDRVDPEEQLRKWLEAGVPCAIRIMPVRSTDFAHLRDGLVRAINVRAKDARLASDTYDMSDSVEEAFSKNLGALKSLFPRTKVQPGQTLDIVVQKTPADTYRLSLQFNGSELGVIESPPVQATGSLAPFTLPTSLLLAYVGTRPDISEPLRKSIVQGLESELP